MNWNLFILWEILQGLLSDGWDGSDFRGLGASGLSEDNQRGRQSIWSGDRDLECEED